MRLKEAVVAALLAAAVISLDFTSWDVIEAYVDRHSRGIAAGNDRQPTVPFSTTGLPPGKGQMTVIANCTVCHSSAIILQNRMSRERWDRLLTWMQKTQNLRYLSPDLRGEILDYLEEHFSPAAKPAQDRRVMPLE